jgi:hypothetical protein
MLEYLIELHLITAMVGGIIYSSHYIEDKYVNEKYCCHYPTYLAKGVIQGVLFPTNFSLCLMREAICTIF